MKMQLNIVLLLVACGMIASAQTAATGTANPRDVANPNAAEISFTETIHDFGIVKKGSPITCKFIYKNTGKEPLVLKDCKAGCHCTTFHWSKTPLLPGMTGFIEVHYDSTFAGSFNKELLVSSNAKTPVVILRVKGTVQDGNAAPLLPVNMDGDAVPRSTIKSE